jgi:hypothetical protein
VDPQLWVVAGCLFEISGSVAPHWEWVDVPSSVTLLGEDMRDGSRHFRFRAEAPGLVLLRWRDADGVEGSVGVRIAPENLSR